MKTNTENTNSSSPLKKEHVLSFRVDHETFEILTKLSKGIVGIKSESQLARKIVLDRSLGHLEYKDKDIEMIDTSMFMTSETRRHSETETVPA